MSVKLGDFSSVYASWSTGTVTDQARVVRGRGYLLKDLKYEVSNFRFDETWRTPLARTTPLSRFQIQQLAVERISEPHSSPVPLLRCLYELACSPMPSPHMHLTLPNHPALTKAAKLLQMMHEKQRGVGNFPCWFDEEFTRREDWWGKDASYMGQIMVHMRAGQSRIFMWRGIEY